MSVLIVTKNFHPALRKKPKSWELNNTPGKSPCCNADLERGGVWEKILVCVDCGMIIYMKGKFIWRKDNER